MTTKAIAAYLAAIGSKGGKAKGPAKRRSREHYVAAGKASAAARAKARLDAGSIPAKKPAKADKY